MSDPLSLTGTAVGIVSLGLQCTQYLVNFYTTVKSQHSTITQTVNKLDHLSHTLESLESLLGNKSSADQLKFETAIQEAVDNCTEYIYELRDEVEKFKKFEDGKNGIRNTLKATSRRLQYPFRQSTLQKLGEDVDVVLQYLSLDLQICHQKNIDDLQTGVGEMAALLSLIKASQIQAEIGKWLKSPDVASTYIENCQKRNQGSGLWLVKGESFSRWLADSNSFLWLRGFAGCGKSVLCSTAIQHTFRHRRSNPHIGIAFFFFSFNELSRQDTSAMLRALVLQLSSQLDSYRVLNGLHESYKNSQPPDQALLGCLRQLIHSFQDVHILIDALDESPRGDRRFGVLEALEDLRSWKEPGLHLMVTSRDEPDIREELDIPSDSIIEMRNESVDSDIAAYVSITLRSQKRFRKWKDCFDKVEAALISRAEGVFRWVECQLKTLETCPECEEMLDQLLDSLPPSLDETYKRMLMNIEPYVAPYAQQLLSILCFSERPLKIPELIEAMTVELGQSPEYKTKRKLRDTNALHKICPGLIEVDETVRIAHFSVQEYLQSDRISRSEAAFYSMTATTGHAQLSCICLTYMLFHSEDLGDLEGWDRVMVFDLPFSKYAAENWVYHYIKGDKSKYPVEDQVVEFFNDSRGTFGMWVGLGPGSRSFKIGCSVCPLYYAAKFGIRAAVVSLIKNGADVNVLVEDFGGPLSAAVESGDSDVIRILIDNNANVDVRSDKVSTPLYLAVRSNRVDIARQLIAAKADVNAAGDSKYWLPGLSRSRSNFILHEAVEIGNMEIIRLLIDYAADVNIQGEDGTPLFIATRRNRQDIARLLIAEKANIDAGGPWGESPLYEAAQAGNLEMVRLLLDHHADVNSPGWLLSTPLGAACAKGHLEIKRKQAR
ncbi:uncharacterized protein N7496_006100 [Penicillium cataractarum]|uniref:NACHT domain-containing protein n=1 Tax=Penicillium cataractarum TaxID=2100454 RepID=A0A9W9S0Y3_9EURO|nr:uncharacterized protein N7496_006100 [Penicillium cataractarum]KAJ5370008.1 hypothetical protein N7496_006100 [Penicillium cataractarum]